MSHLLLWIIIGVAAVVLATATVGLVRVRRGRALEATRRDALAPPEPRAVEAPPSDAAAEARAATAPPAPAGVPEAPPAPVEAPTPSLATRLGAARSLFDRVRALRGRRTVGDEDLAAVEEALLRADVGTATTAAVLEAITAQARADGLGDDGVPGALRRELLGLLGPPPAPLTTKVEADRVAVWLVVGVNGVGKTTTIGKLANAEVAQHPVLLAAADTFRAAAADQLATWAARVGCELVRADEGADPGAVVHDALHRARSRSIPLVLADTAGRLHNKQSLLEELKKVRRVADRDPGQVAEVLLVLDATTGQNAIVQAREFSDAVGVTGIVLTKLDGTARGGVVLAVQRELGIPVRLVGVGEHLDDLVAFDPEAFVDALLGE